MDLGSWAAYTSSELRGNAPQYAPSAGSWQQWGSSLSPLGWTAECQYNKTGADHIPLWNCTALTPGEKKNPQKKKKRHDKRSFDSVVSLMLSVSKYPHLKLGGRVKEELVSQVGWAGSQHHLMSFEWLVVAGYNSDVAKLLAGPQWVHVLQGCVAVARQSKTQHLHLFWGGKQTKRRLSLKERPKSKHRNKNL